MSASCAQICAALMRGAMVSLLTKLSVVPGAKCGGKMMEGWDDMLVDNGVGR